jgi:phospholipid/cholesterol/gamma-HCH transport system substrate-binding protein
VQAADVSRRANPAWIGAFVVGATLLLTAGVLVFGSLELFTAKASYVAYFQTSLTGLDVGAPIRFRGIQVGRVSEIYAVLDAKTLKLRTPVVLDFQSGSVRFQDDEGTRVGGASREEIQSQLSSLIARGLRAEIRQDSILTGKLSIAIDFHPDEPARYVDEGRSGLPEFPTRETGLEKLFKSIQQLPVEKLVTETMDAVEAVRALASSPRIASALQDLSQTLQRLDKSVDEVSGSTLATLEDVRGLVRDVDAQVGPVSDKAQVTLEDVRSLVDALDTHVGELSKELQATLREARGTLGPLERGLGDSRLPHRVAALLEELTLVARRVASLADYLERHPEALIQGKK